MLKKKKKTFFFESGRSLHIAPNSLAMSETPQSGCSFLTLGRLSSINRKKGVLGFLGAYIDNGGKTKDARELVREQTFGSFFALFSPVPRFDLESPFGICSKLEEVRIDNKMQRAECIYIYS